MSVLYFKYFYPDARVLAFEPSGEAFQLLQRNVHENRLTNVRLERKAVGLREGKADFYEDPKIGGGTTNSLIRRRLGKEVRTEEVDIVRLSSYITGQVDLLKIDVEGAEHAVITDLLETNAIANIRRLIVEHHHHLDTAPSQMTRVLDQLKAVGFVVDLTLPNPFPLVPTRGTDRMIRAYRAQE